MKKTIQLKEFTDWILKVAEESPERPINMYQNHSTDKCGCLMVQYARDELQLACFICGYSHVRDMKNDAVYKIMKGTAKFHVPSVFSQVKNFKEAAQIVHTLEV